MLSFREYIKRVNGTEDEDSVQPKMGRTCNN